jgi:hypothetical protein
MTKTITVKKAKDALRNLRKLTPANPKMDDDLEMSVKETVFFMAPDLIQLTKRGLTHREMSKGLANDDIHIRAGTLNRYLNEYLVAKGDLARSESSIKSDDSSDKKPEGKIRNGAAKNPKPDGLATDEKSVSSSGHPFKVSSAEQEQPYVGK